MRVVGGAARGVTLVAPAGLATRPTADRVREAMFNALHSIDALRDVEALDVFAGSGALGIEALSRGAASVTFADSDPAAQRATEKNLAAVRRTEDARVLAMTAERVLADACASGQRFGLVLLDPPYGFDRWPFLLAAVAEVLTPDGVVVIESDRPVDVEESLLEVTRTKRYGGTVVIFARPLGADP